ncbi:hypothetical protein LTR53_001011 [Teratosphaeriaceae sp. CCFEE 6253]|nr:hypothetical protein LTR53_001011 [Teratosphaeriaceae sp. CCFEE 6253]
MTSECKLLELPAELRDLIWGFAVGTAGAVVIFQERSAVPLPPPTLLRVSRQIRHEGAKVYYERNDFHLTVAEHITAPVIQWLRRLGQDNGKHLRSLIIVIAMNHWVPSTALPPVEGVLYRLDRYRIRKWNALASALADARPQLAIAVALAPSFDEEMARLRSRATWNGGVIHGEKTGSTAVKEDPCVPVVQVVARVMP